jgi:predicted dehydrogenase
MPNEMTPQSPVRIAVVGCGQIADAHFQQLQRIPDAAVTAVCDTYQDVAYQAAARFAVPRAYTDLGALLADERPEIVHVTTPPHSHSPIVFQCLRAGAHVYVEKPFTATVAEAEALIAAAEARGLSVCLGHDQLLDPVWVECRELVASGALGEVVHVDAIQGYDFQGPFGRLLSTDPQHWVHRLPGGVFQNVMSHALARITDVLPDETPRISARWYTPGQDGGMPTELRASLVGARVSANLVFTGSARPVQRIARVLGTRRSIEVDLDARVIRRFEAGTWPGPFAKVELPLLDVREAMRNLRRNLHRLRRSDLHYFSGMHATFERFIAAVRAGTPPPVTHREALRVTRIMDEIFRSCRETRSAAPAAMRQPVMEVA